MVVPRPASRVLRALFVIAGVAAAAVVGLSHTGGWAGRETIPARPATLQTAALQTPLPSDPDVLTGRFDNGFRYYLRANKQPLNRAELRLVVNAGSVLEDDDQRGLAHFVEHMAFNGTRHFPKQEIASFMESIGMRFGPSVNATTGFDETIYSLQIPTDRAEVIARAMLILEDWAHNVTFDPDEIERERGVVIEEWRQRRGAGQRMQDAQSAVLYKGSRYAERVPIGTPESIKTFPAARLTAFYRDWYRPDLMALVAVGDFDPRAIEALARRQFAAIPAAKQARPRPVFDLPPQPGTQFSINVDPEAPGAAISMSAKIAPEPQATVGDYRREIVERLTAALLSARLTEAAQRPGAPILGAGAGRARIVRSRDLVSITASLRPEAIDKGIAELFLEIERIARYGFTAEELDRQKTITLRAFDRALAERNSRPSATLAAEYIRNFTRGEPFPGLEYEVDLTKRFLPEVTLDDVNALAAHWIPDDNRAVIVGVPQRPGVTPPTETSIANILRTVKTASIAPYVARANAQPLLAELPTAGTIVKTTSHDAMGITEWTLSNGARVMLMPTTFKQDEVVFGALSPGGTSLAADADLIPAQTAAQVVMTLGVGRFASADLRRALTGKVVGVRPIIGPYEEGLTGAGSPRDLEALFQLIYLHVTQPRRDPALFSALTGQMKSALANQAATPDFAFATTLSRVLSQDHPRARPITADTIAGMNLDRSLAFYRDRFGDAGDFTFVFVGSFEIEAMRPLVEQYLASLPSRGRKEQWADLGIHPPAGIVEERVTRGAEPRSRTAIVFTGPYAPDHSQGSALRAAAEILQTRLRNILREDLGGSYTVTAGANVTRIPRDESNVTVNFGSDPARTDALTARVIQEVGRFTADGPTTAETASAKAVLQREFETASRQNAYLLGQILQRCRIGEAPGTLLEMPKAIAALDAASIRAAARTALDVKRYVRVSLLPAR